ncbi:MAG: FtsX-like permease family protein [archaeon GB-1867-005]|nr:FtsX-like permease family protein [Candidatus Culexmicrobium cathedralense]
MQKVFARVSIKDLLHIVLEGMKKRKSRVSLTALTILLSVALVSSMNIMSFALASSAVSGFIPINLSDYQLWVSLISIIVCVITIFNSMLISVAERYKEIGTMKCLGAKNALILQLFIFESLIIGILGGLAGFLSSAIITAPLMYIQIGRLPTIQTYLSTMTLSIVISVIISLVATAYPAYYATKINPVEALRFEV